MRLPAGGGVGAVTSAAPLAPVRVRSPRRRLTWWRVVGALLVLAAAALGLWRMMRGAPVTVVRVERAPFVERVVASGRVMAPAEVKLGTVLLGKVARVHVDEGARVKAGELLVELDDTEARAALGQARASIAHASALVGQVRGVTASVSAGRLEAAEARYELAMRNHERQKKLFESGAITAALLDESAQALEVARSERDAARAQAASASPGGSEHRVSLAAVAQAEAGRDLALARLELLRVVAPSDGVILRRAVEPGDVVSPGQTLLLLARDGPTRLAVQIDESSLGRLTVGQLAQASADAFPGERFEARVATISPAVDAERGTVEVKLLVTEPPSYLRPDMTVSVDVEVGRRVDVLALPVEALRDSSTASPWVLVAREGRAERRSLRLGVRTTDQAEVVEGLDPGALVILPGSSSVTEGARVRVTEGAQGVR